MVSWTQWTIESNTLMPAIPVFQMGLNELILIDYTEEKGTPKHGYIMKRYQQRHHCENPGTHAMTSNIQNHTNQGEANLGNSRMNL